MKTKNCTETWDAKVGASVGGILGDSSIGSILEDLRYLRIMASSIEDGSPDSRTSGECSKEPVPLMEGEVPEGHPGGEPLTKAATDLSILEAHRSQ